MNKYQLNEVFLNISNKHIRASLFNIKSQIPIFIVSTTVNIADSSQLENVGYLALLFSKKLFLYGEKKVYFKKEKNKKYLRKKHKFLHTLINSNIKIYT